jgi:uncharacterized protein (TIGR02217 family)
MALQTFPTFPGLTLPVKKSMRWDTVKQDALSGRRTRVPLWTYPLSDYELTFSFFRGDTTFAEYQTMLGFIAAVQGAAQLFQYDDPTDDAVTNQPFGAGDGATTAFQLVRSIGGQTAPVFLAKLAAGLVTQITVGGVPTTNYTVSAYGVVTFGFTPTVGASIQWTGGYYQPCRFDDDVTMFEQFSIVSNYNQPGGMFELKTLKMSSEKLP